MPQPGGLNEFINIPVPAANGDGPVVDTSFLVADKTFYLSGEFQGLYSILGSLDNVNYTPILFFQGGRSPRTVRTEISCTLTSIKVRRQASDLATISLGAQQTNGISPNQSFAFPVIPAGSINGAQPSLDLVTLAPPAGLDKDLTFILGAGKFIGTIAIQASIDNVNWSGLGQFESDSSVDRLNVMNLDISALKKLNAVTAFLRLFVQAQILEDVHVSVGAELNAECACT